MVLAALEKGPLHAYGLMKELEKSLGFRPSPGALYPILRKLIREDLVVAELRGSGDVKTRVYNITEKGRSFLEHHRGELEEALSLARAWKRFEEVKGYRLFHAIDEILDSINSLDDQRLAELRRLIAEFELNVIRVLEGVKSGE